MLFNKMVKQSISASQTYAVEKILDYRLVRGRGKKKIVKRIQLFIKWEDYTDSDNTWEPLVSIYEDIGQLVRKFLKDQGLTLKRKLANNLDLDDPKLPSKFTLLGKGGQPLKSMAPAQISKKKIKKPALESGGNCDI